MIAVPRGPYVPELVVAVQAYNRPDTLWRTMRSLQIASDYAHWIKLKTVAFIDRLPDGSLNPIVLSMLTNEWPGMLKIDHLIVADRNMDCNDGRYRLMEEAFKYGDYVASFEDDAVHCYDYFDYIACGFEHYKNDEQILTIDPVAKFGNDRTYHQVAPHLYETVLGRNISLYGPGWFRRTWEKLKTIWTPSGPVALDTGLAMGLVDHQPYTVAPLVARTRHVGFYQGRYSPWVMHSEDQFHGYEKINYVRWDADSFHPKPVEEHPWKWAPAV